MRPLLTNIESTAARLEEVLWDLAREQLGPVRQRELVQAIQELSSSYNRPEGKPLRAGATLPLQQARLLFFTAADLPKVALPLGELRAAGRLPAPPDGEPLRVLDLGAGHGALSLGLLAFRAACGPDWDGPVELWAMDREPGALQLMGQAIEAAVGDGIVPGPVSFHPRTVDLARSVDLQPPFHLVLSGAVLNELPPRRDEDLARTALDALTPDGVALLLEPALRHTSRRLHRLRDLLLRDGAATVLAPCTHSAPCPMLETDRDWCHERRPWQPPPRLRTLAAATALRRRDLRFSFLALAPPGAAPVERAPGAHRVVSDPLGSKGRVERFLCGADGRQRVVLLKRHRGQGNRDFGRLARGDLAWFQGARPAADGLRLEPGSRVRGADPVSGEEEEA